MAVHVFLHEGYADWELGHLLYELRSHSNVPEVVKRPREVRTFGMTAAPLRSCGGLLVTPDTSIETISADGTEALVLPGGLFWRDAELPALDRLVRDVRAAGGLVAGICAASGYLAQLGLLDDVAHTSNSLAFLRERAPGYVGAERYLDDDAVADGGIVTASGLCAVDFTAAVLRELDVYDPEVLEVWWRAFKLGEDPFAG